MEEVGHHNEISISCELVGEELGIDVFVADNIGEEEDCFLGGFVFGIGEVGFSCWCVLLVCFPAFNCEIMGDEGYLLSPMNLSSPVASPSCFTPTVQHCAGGLDAIVALYAGNQRRVGVIYLILNFSPRYFYL
jgi:hypothetical protein